MDVNCHYTQKETGIGMHTGSVTVDRLGYYLCKPTDKRIDKALEMVPGDMAEIIKIITSHPIDGLGISDHQYFVF
jgi:hypothetical protein